MTKGDNASVILLPMGVERGQINKFVQKLEDNPQTDEKNLFKAVKQANADIKQKSECSFRNKLILKMYVYLGKLLTQNNFDDLKDDFDNLLVIYSSGLNVESIQSILEINRIAKVVAEIDCQIEFFETFGENIIDKNNQLDTKKFEERYNELNSQLEKSKVKIEANETTAFYEIRKYVRNLKEKIRKNNIENQAFDNIGKTLMNKVNDIEKACNAEINIGLKKLEGIKNTDESAKLELATIKMWFKRTQISLELINYYLNLLKNFKGTVIYQYEIDLSQKMNK